MFLQSIAMFKTMIKTVVHANKNLVCVDLD